MPTVIIESRDECRIKAPLLFGHMERHHSSDHQGSIGQGQKLGKDNFESILEALFLFLKGENTLKTDFFALYPLYCLGSLGDYGFTLLVLNGEQILSHLLRCLLITSVSVRIDASDALMSYQGIRHAYE